MLIYLLQEPIVREESKSMCCCCCSSGPLTLTTQVPTKGYVAGQSIPLMVEVDNASNVKIKYVMCKLVQVSVLRIYNLSPLFISL